jgi:hypothetical protein
VIDVIHIDYFMFTIFSYSLRFNFKFGKETSVYEAGVGKILYYVGLKYRKHWFHARKIHFFQDTSRRSAISNLNLNFYIFIKMVQIQNAKQSL